MLGVATRLGQNNGRIAVAIGRLLPLVLRTPEKGAASARLTGLTG